MVSTAKVGIKGENTMNHKENHGQVGKALKVKMKLDTFHKFSKSNMLVENSKEISIEDLDKLGIGSTVPIIVDKDTQGDYEVICEHGVEIRYWND